MQFCVRSAQSAHNTRSVWEITPLSGEFEGRVIAQAEGVNMRDVKFSNKLLFGSIHALWGVDLVEDVYSDIDTFKALKLGKAFDPDVEERLTVDFDGIFDRANHRCSRARRLVAVGNHLYGKEAI